MKYRTIALFAASCLFVGVALADSSATGEAKPDEAPGVIDKTGNAIGHAAKATAHGVERGASAAVRGVKRGARAVGDGVERGVQATGRVANKVARKVGLSKTPDQEPQDAKP